MSTYCVPRAILGPSGELTHLFRITLSQVRLLSLHFTDGETEQLRGREQYVGTAKAVFQPLWLQISCSLGGCEGRRACRAKATGGQRLSEMNLRRQTCSCSANCGAHTARLCPPLRGTPVESAGCEPQFHPPQLQQAPRPPWASMSSSGKRG